MSNILYIIGGLVLFIVIIFLFSFGGLYWTKFFKPRYENVNRQVFEETKSYVHGKNEDLAKYFEEYQRAESEKDKEVIKEFVKLRFSEFKLENVNSPMLRQFLVSIRGY